MSEFALFLLCLQLFFCSGNVPVFLFNAYFVEVNMKVSIFIIG